MQELDLEFISGILRDYCDLAGQTQATSTRRLATIDRQIEIIDEILKNKRQDVSTDSLNRDNNKNNYNEASNNQDDQHHQPNIDEQSKLSVEQHKQHPSILESLLAKETEVNTIASSVNEINGDHLAISIERLKQQPSASSCSCDRHAAMISANIAKRKPPCEDYERTMFVGGIPAFSTPLVESRIKDFGHFPTRVYIHWEILNGRTFAFVMFATREETRDYFGPSVVVQFALPPRRGLRK